MSLARFLATPTITASAMLVLASAASAQVAISYSFSQSVGSYVPITGGTVLGTASTATTLDDLTYAVTLPFAFTYDNATQTQVQVSTNGFLSFGGTAPGTSNYTPISSATAYAGAVSAFGRDLQGGFVFVGTRTSSSDIITGVSSLGPIQVGDVVTGTGIPSGATVVAILGTDIQISAPATSTSSTAITAYGPWSEIRHETLGSAPNRVFVVQWSGFKRWGATLTTVQDMTLNFQIRLDEASGEISAVYGNCTPGATTFTTTNQVGLRGPTNAFATNVNNRRNTKGVNDDWQNSVAGTVNTSGMLFNNVAPANVIPNGLEYKWTPVLIASNVNYGSACGAQYESFYENFATPAAASAALSNTSFTMVPTGTGYVVTGGGASYLPPSLAATSLVLLDDNDVDTPTLTTPFPYNSGSTTAFRVCSNGFVSVAAGNTTSFTPSVATLLNSPQTAWWTWHDFNPAGAGSGQVKFEEIGSMVYITWDGVYNFSTTPSPADASTVQYQFDCATGNVSVVFGTLSSLGGGWLVGYSPNGPSLDSGSINLATALPIVTAPDVPALALAVAPRPVLGTTFTYTASNIPLTASVSVLMISLIQANIDLTSLGAPGCFQYADNNLSAIIPLLASPTDTYSVVAPNDLSLVGLQFHGQVGSLVLGINPLNVVTSNGVRSTFASL
jgi:hypothetical protein